MAIFNLNYIDLTQCQVVAESKNFLQNERKLKMLKSYAWGDRKQP